MEQYKTKDLGEAGVLLAKNKTLVNLERKDNICWFIFEGELLEEIVHLYWFGNLLVDAKKYRESMETLKTRIFANK